MSDIEQKNIESNAWGGEWAKKEYENTLKWKEIGKTETEEERKQAAEILQKIEWEDAKKVPVPTHEVKHDTQRHDGEKREKEHPGEANAKRADAGKNLIDEVNAPQTNIISKGLQRIIKSIWWF